LFEAQNDSSTAADQNKALKTDPPAPTQPPTQPPASTQPSTQSPVPTQPPASTQPPTQPPAPTTTPSPPAPNIIAKARTLLDQARKYHGSKQQLVEETITTIEQSIKQLEDLNPDIDNMLADVRLSSEMEHLRQLLKAPHEEEEAKSESFISKVINFLL